MKKNHFSLISLLLIFLVFPGALQHTSAASHASLTLSGFVENLAEVSVEITQTSEEQAAASSLNLNESGYWIPVGTLSAASAYSTPYNISLSSSNDFNLHQDIGGILYDIPYSLHVGGMTFTEGDNGSQFVNNQTWDQSYALAVSHDPASGVPSGTYNDVITFTITAN